MATGKVYTGSEIKNMVLTRVNNIRKLDTPFGATDADEAFDSAIRECGFDLPVAGDDYIDQKNEWIIKRMVYWFYFQVRARYLLLVESGDIKAGGIVVRLTNILNDMNSEFEKARSSDTTAHLFVNSSTLFGSSPLVLESGYVNDSIGQDITDYDTGLT